MGIQVTFISKKELQKQHFFVKYDWLMRAFWTTVRMGICARMPWTEELKIKEFTITIQDINQAIGVQVTIVLETKLQRCDF